MLKAKAQGLQSIINLAVKCWSHGEPTAQLIYLPLLRAAESTVVWVVEKTRGDSWEYEAHKKWKKNSAERNLLFVVIQKVLKRS